MDFNQVKPYNPEEEKTAQLARMFNTISGRYDRFNDLMSWGMARRWRQRALSELKRYEPKQLLDVATGTADMCIKAFDILSPDRVTGIDISEKMLEVGRRKIAAASLADKIDLHIQDIAATTFSDAAFDAVSIAFGIRNFEKLEASLREIYRLLIPGGHLLIIEMNEPPRCIHWAYRIYIHAYVYVAARLLSKDQKAYPYLTASMEAFPAGKELISIMQQQGFVLKKHRRFFPYVCSMYLMQKRAERKV